MKPRIVIPLSNCIYDCVESPSTCVTYSRQICYTSIVPLFRSVSATIPAWSILIRCFCRLASIAIPPKLTLQIVINPMPSQIRCYSHCYPKSCSPFICFPHSGQYLNRCASRFVLSSSDSTIKYISYLFGNSPII